MVHRPVGVAQNTPIREKSGVFVARGQCSGRERREDAPGVWFFSGHQALGQLQRLPFEQPAVDAVIEADQRLMVTLFDNPAPVED